MKKRLIKIITSRTFIVTAAIIIATAAGVGGWIIHSISQEMAKSLEPENATPWFPDYPNVKTNTPLVQRGEYLVKAGDCMACHTNTAEKGQPFAGGLLMQTPFGKLYTPNITPDPETGIGKWTDAQFIKAMREGISPEGHYYYPAFPYLYFSRMSDDDIKAIKAYLDAIPAIKQTNRSNEMVFPFNIRLLQLPWRLMFFHPSAKPLSSENTDPLKRGEYLVEGPGHCGMCHTPSWHIITESLPLGAPMMKYNLTGAKVQGYLAPNISQSNFGNTSVDEIVQVFSEDHLVGGGNVVGPMLEVNHDSLRYLPRSDLEAIATYLKSVKSVSPPKPTGSNAGKSLYENYCAGCHAAGAGGAPRFGDAAAWSPYLQKGMPAVYDNAIKGINGMPAKGTCLSCTDNDIRQAVDYMVKPVMGVTVTASAPVAKKLTREDGKRLYIENCSVCHATGFKGAPKPGDINGFKNAVNAGFLQTYTDVVTGKKGHPVRGACPTCSDDELIAAIKYMLDESAPSKDYNLW
ncbi:MAG: c-type cytochrome [Gammaproteobacteria bacterium]|nr:c-type cytochrome [Gammaproteobacteria bacterium]